MANYLFEYVLLFLFSIYLVIYYFYRFCNLILALRAFFLQVHERATCNSKTQRVLALKSEARSNLNLQIIGLTFDKLYIKLEPEIKK